MNKKTLSVQTIGPILNQFVLFYKDKNTEHKNET